MPCFLPQAIAAALLLALTACQPLPQPFQHAETGEDNPLVVLKDGPGVSLRPIDGIDLHLSDEITTELERAFAAQDVPASAVAANRGSYRLTGKGSVSARAGGEALVIDWQLSDAAGGVIEQRRQETALAPGVAHRESLVRMAQEFVTSVVPKLASPTAKSVLPEAVLIFDIDGAPGDGRTSLKQAIEYVLTKNGVPLAQPNEDNVLVVSAEVVMGKPDSGQQAISIRWILHASDGTELGTVTQANKVKAGSLDRLWGETALLVADAAYDGIGALLQKVWAAPLKPPPAKSPAKS